MLLPEVLLYVRTQVYIQKDIRTVSKGNQIEKHVRNEDSSRRIMCMENEVMEGESSQDMMQSRRNNGW